MEIRTEPLNHHGDGTSRRAFLTGVGVLSLAGFGTVTGRASASPGSETAVSRSTGEEFEAIVDEILIPRIGGVTPGATVAIVTGERPILTKGYGVANVDTENSVQADKTTFRVGSVGKLVTYTAVMQGIEQGVLNLDTDVNAYLDDSEVAVPETYDEPVTLRHLGTHTAGFESALDPGVVATPADLAPLEKLLVENQPSRVRPPGELVGYSNYGAALAGHIVAEVNDTQFEEYVQSEILEPLGMTHSTFAQPIPDDHPGDLAAGHTRMGETFTTTDKVFINMRPAGSLSATATDMAAFMSAHLGDGALDNTRILSKESARLMHDQHHVRHPAVTNWRYGFHEHGDPDADLLGHSGATINFTSHLVLAPEHDIGIFVNYNSNTDERPRAVIDEIISELDLYPSSITATPTSRSGSQERAETVADEYRVTYLPQSGPLQVVDLLERVSVEPARNRRILTETLEGATRHWVETKPYVYHEVDGHDVLAFDVADGKVTAMYLGSEPTGVYQPVPSHERRMVTTSVLGGSLSGFGLSLAGCGIAGAWRQWKQYTDDTEQDTEDSR